MSDNSFAPDAVQGSYQDILSLKQSKVYNENNTSSLDNSSQIYGETGSTINNPETQKVVSVYDVANYILSKLGVCTSMKLHKLLYYCQAWSLVWDDTPLFPQPVEAWANGPVVRDLFALHRGKFDLTPLDITIGNPNNLSEEQKDTVDHVLDFYGSRTPQWLIDQTHAERPWQNARKGLASDERGHSVINLEDMRDYYSSLQ